MRPMGIEQTDGQTDERTNGSTWLDAPYTFVVGHNNLKSNCFELSKCSLKLANKETSLAKLTVWIFRRSNFSCLMFRGTAHSRRCAMDNRPLRAACAAATHGCLVCLCDVMRIWKWYIARGSCYCNHPLVQYDVIDDSSSASQSLVPTAADWPTDDDWCVVFDDVIPRGRQSVPCGRSAVESIAMIVFTHPV